MSKSKFLKVIIPTGLLFLIGTACLITAATVQDTALDQYANIFGFSAFGFWIIGIVIATIYYKQLLEYELTYRINKELKNSERFSHTHFHINNDKVTTSIQLHNHVALKNNSVLFKKRSMLGTKLSLVTTFLESDNGDKTVDEIDKDRLLLFDSLESNFDKFKADVFSYITIITVPIFTKKLKEELTNIIINNVSESTVVPGTFQEVFYIYETDTHQFHYETYKKYSLTPRTKCIKIFNKLLELDKLI